MMPKLTRILSEEQGKDPKQREWDPIGRSTGTAWTDKCEDRVERTGQYLFTEILRKMVKKIVKSQLDVRA